MIKHQILVLCISTLLPACFLSSWPEEAAVCAALLTCDVGYREVGVCTSRDCVVETLCTWSIFCERDTCDDFVCADFETEVPRCDVDSPDCSLRTSSCGDVYCQSALCNGLPMCEEGEDEVATCAGQDEGCHSVSLCGTTIYCTPSCVIPRVCGPTQMQYEDACPRGEFCEEQRACGETVYCVEGPPCESAPPCTGSPSPVVASGGGFCPPVLPSPEPRNNCYVENVCGIATYCITVCDLRHYIVSDPSECEPGGACYPGTGEGVEVWCTGEAFPCDVVPFCEEEQVQMTMGEVCPDEWECRIYEECNIAIQCGQPPRPDGDEPPDP